MSVAPVDRNADAPRYTTVADVKEVLGIDAANTDKDDRITEAIVAVEVAMDIAMGRAMPDVDDAEGPQPPTLIVPSGWSATAKAGAVGVYKASEAPFGTAGADDWLGTISVPTIVSEAIRRNPLMMGWQVSFGMR